MSIEVGDDLEQAIVDAQVSARLAELAKSDADECTFVKIVGGVAFSVTPLSVAEVFDAAADRCIADAMIVHTMALGPDASRVARMREGEFSKLKALFDAIATTPDAST